jgi:sulfite reductase beta subunit-like hemoprotein
LQALHAFREGGSRERRDEARLRYLIEQIGVEEFLRRVEARLGDLLEATSGSRESASAAARPPATRSTSSSAAECRGRSNSGDSIAKAST